MRQIATESMRNYTRIWIQENGNCPWATELNGEDFCHFMNWDCCPYDMMEKIETKIASIPQREFYRCLFKKEG